ncbi:MAG: hypothetical protein RL291_627, partial [Pseudomonadota bacterium]
MYDASAALPQERQAGGVLKTLVSRLPWQASLAPAKPDTADLSGDDARSVDRDVAAATEAEAGAVTPPRTPVRWIEPEEPVSNFALRNFGLTLATFGGYIFWAHVENQKRLVGAIEVGGRRLSYHGRGIEGCISFLIAASLTVVAVVSFLTFATVQNIDVGSLAFSSFRWQRLWITLPLLFLIGSVTYRKRNRILKRVKLDGTAFKLTGEAWSYAWLHFWTSFLVPLSAGLLAPWRAMRLERRKTNEMVHGALGFRYGGNGRAVYKGFAL